MIVEEMNDVKKLYRSKKNRYLGGVAGGLSDYFRLDANIFRLLFVILTFFGGIGLILYITGLVIIPENQSEESTQPEKNGKDKNFILALILISIGGILLVNQFGFFHYFHYWRIPWTSLLAIALIVIGILLVFSAKKPLDYIPDINKIYRSKEDRMIAGVCAGLAKYFNIDPAIVRLIWVLGTFASIGLGVIIYIVLIFIFPEEAIKDSH
jgi:phage shock protein C